MTSFMLTYVHVCLVKLYTFLSQNVVQSHTIIVYYFIIENSDPLFFVINTKTKLLSRPIL